MQVYFNIYNQNVSCLDLLFLFFFLCFSLLLFLCCCSSLRFCRYFVVVVVGIDIDFRGAYVSQVKICENQSFQCFFEIFFGSFLLFFFFVISSWIFIFLLVIVGRPNFSYHCCCYCWHVNKNRHRRYNTIKIGGFYISFSLTLSHTFIHIWIHTLF